MFFALIFQIMHSVRHVHSQFKDRIADDQTASSHTIYSRTLYTAYFPLD